MAVDKILEIQMEYKKSSFMWRFPHIVETPDGHREPSFLLHNSSYILDAFEQDLRNDPDKDAADKEVELILEEPKKIEEIKEETTIRAPPNSPANFLHFVNATVDRRATFDKDLNMTFNHSFYDVGKHGLYSTSAYGSIGNKIPNKTIDYHCKKKTREVKKFEAKKAIVFRTKNPILTPYDFETNGIPSYPFQSCEKVSNLIRDFQHYY